MSAIVRRFLLAAIRGYQRLLSPLLGQRCRYHPSCSQYAADAIAVHGAGRGALLAIFRMARCHPWCEGGVDPVPAIFPRHPWRRSPAPPPDPGDSP